MRRSEGDVYAFSVAQERVEGNSLRRADRPREGGKPTFGWGKHSIRLYAGRIRRGRAPTPPKGVPAKSKILWGEEAQRNE